LSQSPKIAFDHRRVRQLADVTDLVDCLFPGNLNQQHAAAWLLLMLRQSPEPLASLKELEEKHGVSRRTLQRVRAKLAHLGLIEHVTWMNSRYGGRTGWVLSGRMATALRQLAERLDGWQSDGRPDADTKEAALVGLLRPE
jgi:predicted transcriptional regulator